MIDLNGISTHPGLFYGKKFGNHVHHTFLGGTYGIMVIVIANGEIQISDKVVCILHSANTI